MTAKVLVAAAFVSTSMFLFATGTSASIQKDALAANQKDANASMSSTAAVIPQASQPESLSKIDDSFTKSFDCGEVSVSQLTDLQSKSSASVLKDLAKRCDEQAEDYELKAKDALQANNKADVSFLREKAANAYLNVAVFTNSSLFKN